MTTENVPQRLVSSIGLSQEDLKHLIDYDPILGVFTWKNPLSRRVKAGEVAGYWDDSKGYLILCLYGIKHPAHQIAWFYMYGEWSKIDHKDTIRSNNAINNLRKATSAQNSANQGVRITNLLGVKGVQKRGNKFRAYIKVNYEMIHLGTFNTLERAVEVRKAAANKYFGEFTHESERQPQTGELD